MADEKNKKEAVTCPVCRFFMDLERLAGAKYEFLTHLNNSRIEFLKGVRSLLDEGIEHLEKKGASKPKKKMSRIKVE